MDTVGGASKVEAAEDDYKGGVGDAGVAIQEYCLPYGLIYEGRFRLLPGNEVDLCAFQTIRSVAVGDGEEEETRVGEAVVFSLVWNEEEGLRSRLLHWELTALIERW